jgi:IS5 family transposase
MAMRPKSPEAPTGDLFRSSLEAIIDPGHELIRLGVLIDWGRFDDAFGAHYHDQKGRRGLPTRPLSAMRCIACRARDGRGASAQAHEGALG